VERGTNPLAFLVVLALRGDARDFLLHHLVHPALQSHEGGARWRGVLDLERLYHPQREAAHDLILAAVAQSAHQAALVLIE
jgi:hypothetical protein